MLKETKNYLKELSSKIKDYKNRRNRRKEYNQGDLDSIIYKNKFEYRHYHIAYCELNGTSRDRIEQPSKNNLPDEEYIKKIKKNILESINKRLYVITRKDLPCSSPPVQAGHCVAEFCLKSDLAKEWNNNTLIYLEVENLERLNQLIFKLSEKNINYYEFKEPDIDNQITSICTIINDKKIFKNLRLLN